MSDKLIKGLSITACVFAGIAGFLTKKDEIKMMSRVCELEKNVSILMSKND